jgi:uncharacterized protein (DUF305 family)
MNNKSLIRFTLAVVTSSIPIGLSIANPIEAQMRNNGSDLHHPQNSPKPNPGRMGSGMGMMDRQQADRHFIEKMIPHHRGAIEMADLALSKAKRPEIKQLAEAIKKAQNREIEQMSAWYKQWYNAEVPASSSNMMMSMASRQNSNSMGNQEMPMDRCMGMMGMMNADLEALKNAPDFDKAFIEQMIPHHKMAVMMAGMILDSDRPELRELAKSIVPTQSDEIEQMRQWQQTWYRSTSSQS